MRNRPGPQARTIGRSRHPLRIAVASAGAAGLLASAAAVAAPVTAAAPMPSPARGLPEVVNDVLGPENPAFWNPAVPGTRVLTPVGPRDEVICLTGFVPVINCWTDSRHDLGSTPRPLAHVDVPVGSGAPMRLWVDLPRWGDGSTGEDPIRKLANEVVVWWLTNPTPS